MFSLYVEPLVGRVPQAASPTRFPKISPVQETRDPVQLNHPGEAAALGRWNAVGRDGCFCVNLGALSRCAWRHRWANVETAQRQNHQRDRNKARLEQSYAVFRAVFEFVVKWWNSRWRKLRQTGAVAFQSKDVGAEGKGQAELSHGGVFICSCLWFWQ